MLRERGLTPTVTATVRTFVGQFKEHDSEDPRTKRVSAERGEFETLRTTLGGMTRMVSRSQLRKPRNVSRVPLHVAE